MAAYNEEDVQWLYGRMVDDGVDAGTIDDFKKSLKNDADRDWYFKRAKKMGLEVGDADEFRSWTVPEEEPYSWEDKAMTPGDKVEQRTMTAPAQDEEETPSIAGGAAAVGEAGAAAVNRVAKPKPKPKQQKRGAVADWRFRAGMRLAGVNPDNPADNRVSRMQAPRTKPLKAAKRDIAKPTTRVNEESGRVEQVSTAQEQRRLAAEILQDPNTIVNQMTNNGGSVEQIKAEMPEHYTWLQNRMGENTDDFLDETIMWKSLEPSMEKIFEEETAAREKREGHTEEDDWGIGITSVIPGDPNFSLKVALGIARNELGDMEGTHKRMVDRLLSENPAAQRWLEKRAREILKDNTDLYNYCKENNIQPGQSIGPGLPPLPVVITKPPTLLGSREQAKDELLKMFQGRTIQHLAPKNDWQWGMRSFFGNNMWGSLASAAVGVGSGKYEAQQLNEAAMADYEKERAGWVAQVTTPALTLGADILTGGFEIPGLASKGATMLGERLMVTAGKRALGIVEKETAKRAVLHTGNSALLKMLGTGANFGVYDAMSTSLHGLATDTFDWGDTAEAGLKGGFKGFVFGGVGFLGETATKGLTGWKTVLGEAGTLAGETATFAAMDYFQTGELTPVTIGRAFGMSLAGRASHPAQYAADFMARYTGEKWKYMVKQAPTINKDTRDMLVNSGYKNMAEFLYNSQTARNVWRALRGKKAVDEGWAQNYLDTLKNELDLMKNDPSVDWNTIRKAEYVLNGRIMPEATAVNYTMRYVDGQAYGVTLDSTGHEINRYKLKSQKAIDEWKSAMSQKCDENLLMLANETYKYDVSRAAFFYAVMRAADEYGVTMDEALGYYNRHESGGISHTVAERIDQLYRREMERDRRPELVEKVEEKYGVDIDEVMKTPRELRTSNEENAFRELCERLSGTYNTNLDKSTEELIQDQKEQAHDEGMQAEGEQRAELKERLEDAVRELERLGIDPARIDGMDDAAMARWMEENGMDAEKAVAVQEYMTAKAAFEGIRDRVQDESRKRIEESNRQTDERTNSDTGGIHPVKMKEGGEEGRDAFVIKGKIVVNQDGTIDTARSDKDITVFYPDTGEKKVMTIADVKSGEPTIDPEQAKQDAAQQITEEVAGQAADDMNRTLKFNQDDTFNVLVDGKEVELKVVGVDPESGNPILEDRQGRRAPAVPEMVQQMHDEWREWKRNGGEPAVEDGEGRVDNDAAPKVEETPAEEQGPSVMPNTDGDPQEMLDYFRASGMSDKVADKAITNNIVAAAERLEKAQRELEESKETDPQKLAELDRAMEEAQRDLDYWNEVGRRKWGNENPAEQPAKTEEPVQSNGTENQPAEERLRMTAEGIDPDEEYSGFGMSPETVEALDNGSGIVRLVDALAKELGIKVRTFKGSKDAPGYTDPNTGIIWLNTNREDGGFRQTLGHELLHGLKQEAKRQGKPELYTALRDAVLDYVKKQKGDGYEDYYDSMLNRYQNGLYKYGFQQAMDRGASATQANQEGWAHRANVDKDYIEEEIVCDAIGDLIDGNTESASRMLEGVKDKKLLQSIKDYFLDLLKRVKASFKRGDNAKPTPEELAIDRVIENFEKMYKDLIKGRREEMRKEEAGAVAEDEGVHSIEQAAAQDGKLFSFKNEDDLQNKLRKYAKTTDGKRLKWNAEKINEVISETADLIRAVHAALNGDPFYNEFAAKDPTIRLDWRDGEEHPVVTWSRNNVEYKYDMSADLLCVNNDGLEEVLSSPKMCDLMVKMFENEIAKNGGKTYTVKTETDKETGEVKEKKEYFAGGFTSEDYINLYNMLRDMGFVVPCRGCFDAAARLKMLPSVSQKFENQVNDIIGERAKDPEAYDAALREEGRQAQIKENERARRKGEKPKRKVGANGFPLAAPTKEVAIRVAVAADNLTEPITYSQLMSAQGQTEMLSDWGSIFRAWQRTGAGRPKDKLMPEPYTGDITSSTYTIIGPADKRTPNFRDKEVNQGTSLRRNSHSELRPYLIVDEIQFMRDAFVRNLCVFKYMKELDDVRLFGQMGVKFNMSFFPAHDKDGVASGLDANGDYTAAEESVGAREFPYVGADGKTHYDGLRGWAEAQKYCNDDVSLSTVIFSMPHMVKVLTDVPTPDDPSGKWGSAIPFHASGATAKQLFLQGLGRARAIDSDHPFEQEAYTDWEKGVTNFEQVQNDRFGKGWVAVGGKKDGKDMYGHKLEFATSGHYYNAELGLHMVRGGLITDEAWPNMKFNKDGTLNKKALKGVEGFIPMDIDYNNKVRELKSKYGYKEASDYYIQFMQEHGIIPRFHFNVPEEAFLRMCEAAHVDPHHPKLGWKGEGNGWSPIDSPAYYSMFCDYGMTKADGTWSPQRSVGVLNERGEREFRMPANTVDIATEAMKRYTERRLAENAKVDDAISNFADMMVEQGKVSRQQADEALAKTTFDERDSRAREAGEEQVRFSLSDEDYSQAVEAGDQKKIDKMVRDAAKAAGMATDESGKLIDLYHGTDKFGFTIFDRLKSRMGAFFTSTRRNVAANYAGDDHYAGVRKINKGYKQDDSQEGILNNARSVFDQDWKMSTEEQKQAIVTKVEADARKVTDEIEKRQADVETLPTDEELDIANATAWVMDLFYTVAYAKENGNEGEDLYRLVSDGVERYNENKQVIRDYVSKHYDELDEKQKNYLNYLTGWDSGDVAIDIECSYKRVVSGKDLATVTGDSMLTLDELKKNTDEAHNIGSYHLYGHLGDNPLIVDAEGKNWYSLEYEGRKFDTDTLAQYAKENGYTALVVKNVYDYGDKADDYIFFEPSQLKSADPATYDNDGNLIPLSQRFNEGKKDIRFSLSPEQRDAFNGAYADAVESGDQKKVARMVKDAVKAAMPNTKAVDRWGNPRLLYHGTPQENQFYEFNGTIYMSSNRSVANEYTHYRRTFGANPRQTGRIMPVFVNLENPLEIDANRHLWRNIDVEWSDTPVTTRDIEQYAKEHGYDGVIIKRVRDNMYDNDTTAADVYIAFSPEQVKSAGPTYEQKKRSHFPWDDYSELAGEVGATYDNDGNLIPLSERFDLGKKDIRFSLSEDTQKIFDTAKRKFGETQDIREAGYVLPDGTMLDFSGRHELDPGSDSSHLAGRRHTDHRAVNQISFVYDENGDEVDTGVNSDMPDFIRRGAIRIDNNAGLINLSTKPTAGQRKALRQLVAENGGTVDVDFGDGWDTDHHVEYNNAKATRVLGDIDRYFDEGIKPQSNVRFSLGDTFYSNAAKAVEGVKQEKAKAEQWKAMLTKAGGIKAGEDKWMGLSTWLDEHKGETLTKDEVMQFVRDNAVQMQEVDYGELNLSSLQEEFDEIYDRIVDGSDSNDAVTFPKDQAWEELRARYNGGDDFDMAFSLDDRMRIQVDDEGRAGYFLGANPINSTRLDYTTEGLENKREIAFVVPGIEPYQEGDEVHFGPENEGRAVMWVRFGEARDADGNRVLVIDEIQSNRHQDAREKGYKKPIPEDAPEVIAYNKANKEYQDYLNGLREKYGQNLAIAPLTKEEQHRKEELTKVGIKAAEERREFYEANGLAKFDKGVPTAPFEKNWHEVAMKRMLRLAAEEGFDKVAWTTGEQQSERYGLGGKVDKINVEVEDEDFGRWVEFDFHGGGKKSVLVNNDGIIEVGPDDVEETTTDPLHLKDIHDVVGKELGDKILSVGEKDGYAAEFSGDDLRIGGEGMKGFYDQMLPRFMDKYGKKWGVKVGEVTLDTPGGETMHSVDVNEDMKRSVMQGQPLFSLSLGAPYQGSKGQIATSVVDMLPKGKRFVDLFSGGGAMTHAAMLSGKYEGYRMNDINPAGQDLFLGGMRGDYRDYIPGEMTDEEFKAIKGTPEGLMLSYGGLGRNIDNDAPTRDRRIRRVQRLEALKPYADKVEASNTDYREVQLQPGDVVYADIPYDGTNKTGYREGAKFDKQAFSEWGLEQDVPIYVSEQSMPKGWVEVASWNMRAMRGKQRDEKLFVQEKFADQVRDEIAQYPDNTDGPKFQLTEDIENYQPRDVSWERAMLDRLMETAGRNREAVDKRRDALRTLNSQAGALRRAMSKQREYDRWTVDDLVSMAKSMLKSGLYKGMSPYEVQRLVGMINQGAGREDITRQANAVFDLMMKHHVKEWENQFNKLLRIRENKIDKNGVRVQGALDPKGQRMVKALREGITMSEKALEDRIWDCRDRMGSDDSVVAGNAADEYEGLMHAQQHYDNIGRLNEALEELRHERRTQLERVYEYWREERVDDYGNVIYRQDGEPSTVEKRRVRPEFGGVDENGNRMPVSEENKAIRKQVDATVASIEQAMRETEVELAEGYRSLCDNVGGSVAGSITRAKEWVESEKDRVSEIHHAANSDLLNTEEKLSGMDRSKEKGIANNAVVRFVNSPLGSFEKFMRYFGQRSAYGEGRLYNKFMRGHSDCTDAEWRAYKEGLDAMNQKSEELFGCSWEKLMVKMRGGAFANTKGKLGIEREFPPVEVSYWVDGKRIDDTLNQDEVAYLIACSKMTDGMMKLENMGIDENMIAQLRQQVDPKMLQLADWYQHEFLPKQRTRINEVYKRMFGADMAHIDNYIHLNINERGLVENKDINQRMAASETPSTITGSLKERKRNTKPIDLHTSILDLALEEHQKMENWIAWAEYNRDLKDLLNYKKFKNKVYNMKSVELGSGEQLWDKFSKAVAVVTGDFQGGGKHSEMDRFATNVAKFVSSGCINFRVHTALKQVLSFPAFMSDARPGDILFAAGNAMGSVQWAMENLPGFSKRWESRRVGDTRLMDTDSDYSFWRNRWVQKVNKVGMTANASVDCLTVAIGARAVYETAKRRYLSYGYNEEQAERKALQDAYVSYNSSQQSSEGAFVSPMQVERTFLSAIGTTFRNASMGYQRRVTTGARNIARMLKKGYKEDMIENTKKQMMEEGLSEEQAQRAAERVYNRQLWHSMMDVANFGYALPFLWILGPTLSYLIAGDDDKIKKDTLSDLARHAMFGPIEGLTFGGVMSELGNMVLNNRIQGKEWKDLWNELKNKDLTPLPLVSRMQGLFDSFGKGWWEGINDFTGLLIQSCIGVDPNTITDFGVAILDACNGDLDTSKEVALGLMRILQFPQSQIDNLYIDELGLNGKDLGKYSYEELARRYARYKTNRDVLPTAMRSDEANDAAEEKVMKRFEAKVQERLDAMDADQLGQVFDSGDPDLKKIIGAKVAKDAGLKNERYSKKPDADAKPETAKATEAYQNKRNWGDISEDILLQQAKAGATADGDDERAKKIEKALSAITKLRNGDPKKGIKGMGVDKKTDDRILKEIRETRSKALKELKISR